MSRSVHTPLIAVRSLSIGRGARPVLDAVTFDVEAGERVAIVGPSGVGKSTLLQIIAGLVAPSQGGVAIQGSRVRGPLPSVTMMLQRPALLPWASVLDNVMLGLRFTGPAHLAYDAARRRAVGLLAQVGLAERAGARPAELSGGEQQRVALARALAPRPSVLLLDEPFSALDTATRVELRRLVAQMAVEHSATLLLVTHDRADADALCSRTITLGGSPARIVSVVGHSTVPSFAPLPSAA